MRGVLSIVPSECLLGGSYFVRTFTENDGSVQNGSKAAAAAEWQFGQLLSTTYDPEPAIQPTDQFSELTDLGQTVVWHSGRKRLGTRKLVIRAIRKSHDHKIKTNTN